MIDDKIKIIGFDSKGIPIYSDFVIGKDVKKYDTLALMTKIIYDLQEENEMLKSHIFNIQKNK